MQFIVLEYKTNKKEGEYEMKEYFKKFSKLWMLLLALFTTSTVVNAETAPSALKVTNYIVSNVPVSFPAPYHAKVLLDSSRYAYCTYYSKTSPHESTTYRKGNLVTDNGMNYILSKSYGIKNDGKHFIYQTALWTYMIDQGMMPGAYYDLIVYRANLNYNYSDAANQVKSLVSEAKKASANDTSAPTIKISTSGVKFTYNAEKGTYVSSPIIVTSSTGKYTVSLSGAPKGTNAAVNGNQLILTIPRKNITTLTTSITINVSNEKKVYASYYYNPDNSSYQTVAITYEENKTAKAKATIKLNDTRTIDILKVDENGQALKGAKMQVVNSKGTVIDSWTSDGNKHTVSKLTKGTYTVQEVSAPKGYILDTTEVKFSIDDAGKITNSDGKTITLITVKNKRTSITVSKQDITNGKELPGATLVIKNANGEEVAKWTSSSKAYVIKGLDVGTYTLTETVAPKGYVLSTETITFSIDAKGNLTNKEGKAILGIAMYNKPED